MMFRTLSAIMLASTLCCVSACEDGKPPASKSDANKPDGAEPAKTKAVAPPTDGPSRTPAVVAEAGGSTPAEPERPPAPAWFDATKIEHETVVNQMASEGTIAGGYASAMVLELEPGVTAEQCVEMARKALGETLAEVPEAAPGDGGRLMLQGKTDSYHYTVVCGDAKGKPTMYMSYTAKH